MTLPDAATATAIETPTNTAAAATTTTSTPDGETSAIVFKPGMTTSEFAVTLLIIAIGGLLASGLVADDRFVRLGGEALMILKAIAYTWSRTAVKTAGQ